MILWRHPSADAQAKRDFEKLREELRALKEELNQPEDEESLVLSPREEREIRDEVNFLETSAIDELMHKNLQEPWDSDPEDVFNDDMDDFMIQCSQQVEQVLQKTGNHAKTVFDFKGTNGSSNSGPGTTHTSNRVNSVTGTNFGTTSNKFFADTNNTPPSSLQGNCGVSSAKVQPTLYLARTCETRTLSPALNDLINKPKFVFKKNTSPSSRDNRNLTESHEVLNFEKIFQPLVQDKKPDTNNLRNFGRRKDCPSGFSTSNAKEQPCQPKNTTTQQLDAVFDDSFDVILSQMEADDLDQLTQVVDIKTHIQNIPKGSPISLDNTLKIDASDTLENLLESPTNTFMNNIIGQQIGNSTSNHVQNRQSTIKQVQGSSMIDNQLHNKPSTVPHVQARSMTTNNQVQPRSMNTSNQVQPRSMTTSNQVQHRSMNTSNQVQPRSMTTSNQVQPRSMTASNQVQPRSTTTSNQVQPRSMTNSNEVQPRPVVINSHVQSRVSGTNQVQTSNQTNKKSTVFPRCNSDGAYGGGKVQTATGKVEFYRTQSFEISNAPIKCSPEEIEKKRLAALAIREAKKQKDIIEKNRQEALKRLEEKRKRNVQNVKSSLVKRL